jgi:hypothetical protein
VALWNDTHGRIMQYGLHVACHFPAQGIRMKRKRT